CIWKETNYHTVVSELRRINAPPDQQLETLSALALSLDEPTLIYCASPDSVRRIANALLQTNRLPISESMTDAANWVAKEYHPDWMFGRALVHGVGMHHGKLPRSLATFVVRAFNEERLRYLICTSTLIEG